VRPAGVVDVARGDRFLDRLWRSFGLTLPQLARLLAPNSLGYRTG